MRPREDARREPARSGGGDKTPARRGAPVAIVYWFRTGGIEAMSRSENASKLAIACCIHQCSESPAPLTCLQDYLDGLRECGWDDDAISAIKRDVLAALTDAGRDGLTEKQ